MNSRTVLLSILSVLIPVPALALPFKAGDYICPRNNGVEIRAGVKIAQGADPHLTLQANPPQQRAILGRVSKEQCMVVIRNQANGFPSGGYTWYNVYRRGLQGWTAGEFFNWSGNLFTPEEQKQERVISDASEQLKLH